MKKLLAVLLAFPVLFLSGCALLVPSAVGKLLGKTDPVSQIDTMRGWSFQKDSSTNDYSVFFGFLDESDREIAAAVDVDIRIEDEKGTVLYSGAHSVKEDDFDYCSSEVSDTMYLCRIRIPASSVKAGKSHNGTVYLNVRKGDTPLFDEVSCSAFYCLPVLPISITSPSLPVEIRAESILSGTPASVYRIEQVSVEYDSEYSTSATVTVSGTKTAGKQTSSDMVTYKLYDGEGYMVKSGQLLLSSLASGDKFRVDTIILFDVVPGENYRIEFSEYDWGR